MKRKIYDQLLKWKVESQGTTSLLIDGARRTGKSYIAEEFAKNEYKSYILIDFFKAPKEVKDLFDNYLDDLDNFFLLLKSFYKVELYERDTLIIFDEVQLFPRARGALKYLVADGRYDYIETGSLLSIKENVKDIIIPSEEEHILLHPMDFEEFLWAMNEKSLMEIIRLCFNEKKSIGPLLHRKAMNLFRQYLIVGGMPQVVDCYIKTRSFENVDKIKRNILSLYKNDIAKHASRYKAKVLAVFNEIPSQLNRHEKKFDFAALNKSIRKRDYEDALFWLEDAMIVNHCYNTTEPNIGLKLNMEQTSLKCYMADTGLLLSHTFDEQNIKKEDLYKKILFDKLEFNEGMIVENIVAQMLRASGHNLYFYSKYSTEASLRMEIDFLISKNDITSRHNISPIEVKSGKNYTLNSLNKFKNKFSEYLNTSYVIHPLEYKEENGVIYLPYYMTPLL